MSELVDLASKHGTDKHGHGYMPVYERLLAPLKDQPITLLELGVQYGNSIRMWREYFTNKDATIIGVECESNLVSPIEGCEIVLANAGDVLALADLVEEFEPFDIIIDDAGHEHPQQLMSFYSLFPFLSKGGLYFIEDLHNDHITKEYFKSHCAMFRTRPICGSRADDIELAVNENLLLIRKRSW